MPLKPYDQQLPDPPVDAPLWRFMPLDFFQDFMANEELYLRRCDKFKNTDPQEGLPKDEYVRKQLNLRRYDVTDEITLNYNQGSNRLFTEMYFLSCWNLYNKEHEMQMWQQYARGGVAVQTTFGRLREVVLQFPDDVHIGKVRYGDDDMTRYNLLQFLFTKGRKFSWESEVRIALCSPDPKGGQARNYRETNFPHREPQDDLNPLHPWVHDFKRRRFLLKELVTGIAISPWATEDVATEVKQEWANIGGHNIPVDAHATSSLLPSPEDFAKYGVGSIARTPAVTA